MNTPIADLTALLQLIDQVRGKPADAASGPALQMIGQALVDLVAMKEAEHAQEQADQPKEEAAHAAKLAALQAIPDAIRGMAGAVAQALADRPAPPVPSSPQAWTKLQVNVNTDRMGRMESFTVEKVA